MAGLFCGFVGFDVVDAHGLLWGLVVAVDFRFGSGYGLFDGVVLAGFGLLAVGFCGGGCVFVFHLRV